MAIIQNNYTGNGSQTIFGLSFPYLKESDVDVTLNGTVTTAYTFPTTNTIQFTTAPGNGVAISISRNTQIDEIDATFYPGSTIRAQDLNDNFSQFLYVAQESEYFSEEAFSTANTALTNANAAVSTANTASANATTALNTANAANATANTANTNASNAVTTANNAVTIANSAVAAVASALIYTIVANIAAIPATPANNTAIEVTDSTGIQSFTPLSGIPGGFVGSPGLSVRIVYKSSTSSWTWIQYFPNDPENRYLKLTGGTTTGPIVLPLGTQGIPSLQFNNINAGIFSSGTGSIALSTMGLSRMSIDSAGSVSFSGAVNANSTLAVTGSLTKNGFNVITTGDTGTVTSAMLLDGTIVNGDISASAGIAHTKLANITAGQVLLGNASNIPTATALSGDVTIDSSGNTFISSGVIVDSDISANAEIAVSKLADGAARQLLQTDATGTNVEWANNIDIPGTLDVTGIATFDSNVAVTGSLTKSGNNVVTVGDSGTVTSTMIADGTIVDGDINASAAIAGTKISPDFGSQTVQTTGIVSHALGSQGAPTVTFTGDPNTGIYSPGADQVAISTGGSGRLFINSSGQVGVGTSSPDTLFHLEQASSASAQEFFRIVGGNRTDNLFAAGLRISTGATSLNSNRHQRIICDSNFTVQGFETSTGLEAVDTNVLLCPVAGRVGIGTSSPGAKLVVDGGTSGDQLRLGTNPHYYKIGRNSTSGPLEFYGTQSGVTGYVFGGVDGTRLTIDSSGRVGVGTSSPSYTLDVTGTHRNSGIYFNQNDTPQTEQGTISRHSVVGLITRGITGSVFDWSVYSASGNAIITNQTGTNKLNFPGGEVSFTGGNVGIGTSSPATLLHLSNTSQIRHTCTSTANAISFWKDGTPSFAAEIGCGSATGFASALKFDIYNGSSWNTAVNIDSSSRVGIGTTSPATTVHAVGTVRISRSDDTNQYLNLYSSLGEGFIDAVNSNSGTNQPIIFRSGNNSTTTERARIDSSGNILKQYGTALQSYTSGGSVSHMMSYGSWNGTGNLLVVGNTFDGIVFGTGGGTMTEKARFDASGRLLVGTSTTSAASTAIFEGHNGVSSNPGVVRITKGVATPADGDVLGYLAFSDSTHTTGAQITGERDGGTWSASSKPSRLVFSTTADGASSPTERMRITQSGFVNIGNLGTDIIWNQTSVNGVAIGTAGSIQIARSGDVPLLINRNTNDGTLVALAQAGVEEGNISVSGTTVSYNGAHLSRWSQLPSAAERTEILRGSVLSNIDEMCEWGDEENEQLNRMKVSDVEGDRNVSGVFQCWDDDDDTYTNDFYCAMTGDFIIRIGAGVTVERGDLLMSAGDGTAKPQDDDIIRSKTIAKVTSTNVSCTYEDGSYCVPCVLMAC